jgi:SAM-dependent methyltransferase
MGSAASDASSAFRAYVLKRFDREQVRDFLSKVGFDATAWVRVIAYRECGAWLQELGVDRLNTLEIAPGYYWRRLPFKSYREVNYPAFDICKDQLGQTFDLIIADQVFEHVRAPWTAARHIRAMLTPGGHFLCIVPFLVKVHGYPEDSTRWTENGLRWLLEDAGLAVVKSGSWGNRSCATANFRHGWRMYGFWRSLRNEPDFPVVTWALAKAA